MSDNLVKDYLEEIGLISQDQYLDSSMICGDKWEIYQPSDETLLYVKFELTGKLGYAFCAEVTCRKMTINFESFYHVKSYGNEIRESWECDQSAKDSLVCSAIAKIKPY